jgi:endo-1,4-beta-xylanase
MNSQSDWVVGLALAFLTMGGWGCSTSHSNPADGGSNDTLTVVAGAAPTTETGDPSGMEDAPSSGSGVDSGDPLDGGDGPTTDGSPEATEIPGKFVGNIDTRRAIRPDFVTYWNQFTPENAGKWASVQPNVQSEFKWTSLDAMYKYCGDNNIVFKQHNFVWGSQQPTWTNDLTTADGPAAVQNWINAFCERYPDTKIIDVVNEPPPHTTPRYMAAIGGAGSSGHDWIVNAFKWARQACPNAILVLNDYNNIENSGDAQHIIDIVNAIQKAGAPIDAVGAQAHDTANLPSSTLKSNIDRIAHATGLPVYITEYDLDIEDDSQQAAVMQDQFTMFWNHNNVKGITLWGYVVQNTWRANTGLMLDDGTMRPAMRWLMDFLGR